MATDTIEYKIIIIDSDNAHYNIDDSYYDFYVDILEPLRDVFKIKILYDGLSIPNSNLTTNSSSLSIKNLDTIYIYLNGYSRVKTTLLDNINPNNNNIDLSYFDSITIDLNKIKNNTGVTMTTMFNDFNVNEADYILSPIVSHLNKINIQIKDKKNNLLTKSYAERFIMKLCVYYKTKKISRF